MPYLGQRPSKGDENNFKILDDISSYTLTFDGSDSSVVSAANDTITSLTHRFVQGQRVTYNKGSGGTVIAGLSDGVYYIIKHDHHTIKLATSASNASNGTAVDITGVGGGSSHTLNVAFDGVNTKFKATHTNGQKAKITRSAQLVISINGVIQQPHDSATPSTGFGFDLDGTIVLSQAPVTGDVYWAHVLTNNNVTFDISDNDIDNFTGNGSTTEFNLSKTPPDNRNVLVTVDGVVQYPNDPDGTVRAYNVVENVLTFVTAPDSGVEIQVRHIGFAGSSSGSGGGGGVTNFYGRTGSVVLKNTDNIVANNAEFAGNLTVQGTMTTLDTKVTEVDQLEVAANNTTVGVAITQSGSGDILNLYDSSTEVFSVADGGGVTLSSTIDVTGQSTFRDRLQLVDGTPEILLSVPSGGLDSRILNDGSGNLIIGHGANSDTPTEVLRIKSGGEVGIGTTNPSGKLDVRGDVYLSNDIYLTNGSGGYEKVEVGLNDIRVESKHIHSEFGVWVRSTSIGDRKNGIEGDGNDLLLYSNTTEKVRINSDGKVGLGTTGSDYALSIREADNNNKFLMLQKNSGQELLQVREDGDNHIIIDGSHASGELHFYTAGTERVRIATNGRVGVGITNPEDYFSSYSNLVVGNKSDTGGITIVSASGSGGSISFAKGTSGNQAYRGLIRYDQNNDSLTFATDSIEKLRITSGGDVGIGTTNPAGGSSLHIHGSGASDKNHIRLTADRGLIARLGDTSGSAQAMFDLYDPSDGSTQIVKFISGGTDNFVNTGGNFLINASSSVDVASTAASKLQVKHTSGNISAAFYSVVDNNGPSGVLALGHARGSTSGILQNNDTMGQIRFAGGDGNDLETTGAQISAEVDGSPASNSMPSRLVLSTMAGTTLSDRFFIRSSGDVQIQVDGSGGANSQQGVLRFTRTAHSASMKDSRIVFDTSSASNNTDNATYCSVIAGQRTASNNGSSDLKFYTCFNNGSDYSVIERLTITETGQVVVGAAATAHADTILHVEKTLPSFGETNVKFEGNDTMGARLSLQNNKASGSDLNNQINFCDAGGQSTSAIIGYNTDQTNNYGDLALATRDQSGVPPEARLYIRSDGRTSIGPDPTGGPSATLHVREAGNPSSTLGGAPASIMIEATTNANWSSGEAGAELLFKKGGDITGAIRAEHDRGGGSHSYEDAGLAFYTAPAAETPTATRKFIVKATGDCVVEDGNITFASGHGIDFSATANNSVNELLDDYEEGSWTPQLTYGSSGEASYSWRYGYYIKVGAKVTVWFNIGITGFTPTNTQNVWISNLPFENNDPDSQWKYLNLMYGYSWASGWGFNSSSNKLQFLALYDNQTRIRIVKDDGAYIYTNEVGSGQRYSSTVSYMTDS